MNYGGWSCHFLRGWGGGGELLAVLDIEIKTWHAAWKSQGLNKTNCATLLEKGKLKTFIKFKKKIARKQGHFRWPSVRSSKRHWAMREIGEVKDAQCLRKRFHWQHSIYLESFRPKCPTVHLYIFDTRLHYYIGNRKKVTFLPFQCTSLVIENDASKVFEKQGAGFKRKNASISVLIINIVLARTVNLLDILRFLQMTEGHHLKY